MEQRYRRMLHELSGHINPGVRDNWDRFIDFVNVFLTSAEVRNARNLFDVCDKLLEKGIISYGEYGKLLDIFEIINHKQCQDIVKKYSSGNIDASRIDRMRKSSEQDIRGKRKRHRYTEGTYPDVEEDKDHTCEGIYKKMPAEKGYMVILVWIDPKHPHESDNDVAKVSEFFKDELNWTTEMYTNLTESELTDKISKLQLRFKDADFAKKYYCLGLTVIGHGEEGKLILKAGTSYKIEKLIDAFKNHNIPNLLGKPKFFLIEACRGLAEQQIVERMRQPHQTPEMTDDVKISLPVDSDLHIAYATTTGYGSHFGETGSWFISTAMDEFMKNYQHHNMENMLTNVRHKVAAKRSLLDPNKGQMPCSWTTFTKRKNVAVLDPGTKMYIMTVQLNKKNMLNDIRGNITLLLCQRLGDFKICCMGDKSEDF